MHHFLLAFVLLVLTGALSAQASLGPGCGVGAPTLSVSGALTVPSADLALVTQGRPGAALLLLASVGATNLDFGNGCHIYVDPAALIPLGVAVAGPIGNARLPVPIGDDPSLVGLQVAWQALQLWNAGPFLGVGELSNGVRTTFVEPPNFPRLVFSINKGSGLSAAEWNVLRNHADLVLGLDGHGYEFPGLIDDFRAAAPGTPVHGFVTSMGLQRTGTGDWRFRSLDRQEDAFLHCGDPASLKVVVIAGQTRLFWVRDDRSTATSSYPNPNGVLSYVLESAPAAAGPWTQEGAAIPHSSAVPYHEATVNSADPLRWYRVRSRLASTSAYTDFSWPTQPDPGATGFAWLKVDASATFHAGMWGTGPANPSDVVLEWGNLGGWGYPTPAATRNAPVNGITVYVGTVVSYPTGNGWTIRLRSVPQGVASMKLDPARRNNRIISKYGEHLFKPDHPSAVAMHRTRLNELQALGAHGLRLDFAIDSYPSWYVGTTPQGQDGPWATIEPRMLVMLNALQASHPQMQLWANGISVTSTWSGILDYAPPLAGVDCEFLGWSSPTTTAPFRDLDMLDGTIAAAHGRGLQVTCYSYAAPTDIEARITSLARYWLVFRPNVYFQYMTQDNHQSVDYFPEFDVDMGRPLVPTLGSRNSLVAGSVYRRAFTKGLAFYNPTAAPVTVALPGPHYVVSATGTWSSKQGGTGQATFSGPVTSVVLPARRGALLVVQPGLGR